VDIADRIYSFHYSERSLFSEVDFSLPQCENTPGAVETPDSCFHSGPTGFFEVVFSGISRQFSDLGGAATGPVLRHDVNIGIGRDVMSDKPHNLSCAGQAFGQNKVSNQQTASGDSVAIDHKVTHLAVHFP
jgi:hypothetical protein